MRLIELGNGPSYWQGVGPPDERDLRGLPPPLYLEIVHAVLRIRNVKVHVRGVSCDRKLVFVGSGRVAIKSSLWLLTRNQGPADGVEHACVERTESPRLLSREGAPQ